MQYDPQAGQGVHFVEYVDTFSKLKTEGSGNSDWFRTPEYEDRNITNFLASEGIHLDKEAIKPNAVKRGLAKL